MNFCEKKKRDSGKRRQKVRDSGFAWKRSGNAGSGPPLPDPGLSYAADGKLAFNLVNKLNWPENSTRHVIHHEYNLAKSRSVRWRNSGVDRVCNGKTNHRHRRAINRFRWRKWVWQEENWRNVRMTCWIVFARNTANSSHLSPEEWNEKQSISAL